MASNTPPNFQDLARKFRVIHDKLPGVAGAIAVRRSKANFKNQGWTPDKITLPWKNRSKKDKSKKRRAILIQTGALRRSVRIMQQGAGWVRIGSSLPYAKAHNEGDHLDMIVDVRRHVRKNPRGNKTRGKKKVSSGISVVSPHKRKMNTRIPRSRFLGPNSGTMREINDYLTNEIEKAVKQWA